jgi:serine-type D-Ala-D-Ala carboxypeptidase (penicillin-binding protein 5/6)
MHRKRVRWCSVIFAVFFLLSVPWPGGAAEPTQGKRIKVQPIPGRKAAPAQSAPGKKGAEPSTAKSAGTELSPGQINAKSAILVEVSTGAVLFEQNADEIIEPASFTKIVSLYLVFEALKQGRIHLNDEIWISETAWRTQGSKMFVGIGTKVPLEELLRGIAVVSGNDACVAAAEHVSGSVETFVDAMNRKTQELGMSHSRFLNPHGLPAEGQTTTARDMATLDSAYLRRFPESLQYHSMREFTYNNIVQYNRNHLLLKDQTVDGLKTGYVAAAGYHLAATAKRDGMRLLAVVMGAGTPAIREREALKLLNFGFRYYTLVQPFPQGQPVTTIKVWKGERDQLGLYPLEAAGFLVSQAQKAQLRWEIHAPTEITAPVQAGQNLGEVTFYIADQAKRTVPLVSQEDLPLGGWFKRVWQSFLMIHLIDWKLLTAVSGSIAALVILVVFLAGRKSTPKRSKSSYGKK